MTEPLEATILRVKLARAKLFRSLYFNVCHCAAYTWAHRRYMGRCCPSKAAK